MACHRACMVSVATLARPPVLLLALAYFLSAGHSRAQSSCRDLECGEGYSCQEFASPSCQQDCEVQAFCVGAPCDSAEDCPDYMACAAYTRDECPDDLYLGCLEGESDPECMERTQRLIDESCQTVEERSCVPKWEQPCQRAEDCGEEGFICSQAACQPEAEPCQLDADCPDHWRCAKLLAGPCTVDTGPGEECPDPNAEFVYSCVPPATAGFLDAGPSGAPSEPTGGAPGSGGDEGQARESSGCAVAPPGPVPRELLALIALGLGWVLRRRAGSA